MENVILTKSERETFDLGLNMAKDLKAGSVICLSGDLGAGKTVFTKGICSHFNVSDYVTSPTYTIVNEYSGDIKIYHFDIYRLYEEEELYNIGFYDYLEQNAVCLVEWSENIRYAFPDSYFTVRIEKDDLLHPESRRLSARINSLFPCSMQSFAV